MKNKHILKLTYSALCLALALLLPLVTGQIPQIGKMLSPMHIAIFLCGFLCGWSYGMAVGAVAPILRSLLFGMPLLFPDAVGMAFELAAYGLLSGLLDKLLPKKIPYIYVTLIVSMIGGRIVWGCARFLLSGISGTEFPFSAFLAGAVTNAIPGIVLHIVLVPALVIALRKLARFRDTRSEE